MKLHAEVVRITSDPAFKQKNFIERAIEYAVNDTPEQFMQVIVRNRAIAAQIAKESAVQPQ